MKIITGKFIGFCSGVKRAIKIAEETGSGCTLGPLIHNPSVVKNLERNGIFNADTIEDCKSDTVIIPSHGCTKEDREKIEELKLKYVDATCPIVKRNQKIAETLKKEGYQVVIIGDPNHREVVSVLSYAGEDVCVIGDKGNVGEIRKRKIGIIPQTTLPQEIYFQYVHSILSRVTEARVFNTLCKETLERQKEAVKLAKRCDCVIVIGGKNSANTKRIFELCKKVNKNTHHIEKTNEIKFEWFEGVNSVAITSGASTPEEQVKEVKEYIKNLVRSSTWRREVLRTY